MDRASLQNSQTPGAVREEDANMNRTTYEVHKTYPTATVRRKSARHEKQHHCHTSRPPPPPPRPVHLQTTLIMRPTAQHPTHRPRRTSVLAAPATARKPALQLSRRRADMRKSRQRGRGKGASCRADDAQPATAVAHVLSRTRALKLQRGSQMGTPYCGCSALATSV